LLKFPNKIDETNKILEEINKKTLKLNDNENLRKIINESGMYYIKLD
jgi:hypothetical protein